MYGNAFCGSAERDCLSMRIDYSRLCNVFSNHIDVFVTEVIVEQVRLDLREAREEK